MSEAEVNFAPARTASPLGDAVLECVWTGLFAILFTGLVSGIWSGLLLANLKLTPAIPWAIAPMALSLWLGWSLLGGPGGLPGVRAKRAAYLRAGALPAPTMLWAVAAGASGIAALSGLWIVLHALIKTPTNPLAQVSQYPPLTVVLALAMASISGGVSEEAGFRGYFQGALEKHGLGWVAVAVTALVMAPIHAETQGFVWPNIVFYLLVDGMLGALAYLTKSIRPGIVVHALGLFVFFTLIWRQDASRPMFAAGGDHAWFWIHVAQTIVFAGLSAAAFARLARGFKKGGGATGEAPAQADS
ncbi:MAG TPA: CPBP family intramembrane glutamic endopeptidase [Caulobacteraceae bacterium]|nr:CPBP family intramembrane glutamic endopeptidase [Caulobacteraceae bacterium]